MKKSLFIQHCGSSQVRLTASETIAGSFITRRQTLSGAPFCSKHNLLQGLNGGHLLVALSRLAPSSSSPFSSRSWSAAAGSFWLASLRQWAVRCSEVQHQHLRIPRTLVVPQISSAQLPTLGSVLASGIVVVGTASSSLGMKPAFRKQFCSVLGSGWSRTAQRTWTENLTSIMESLFCCTSNNYHSARWVWYHALMQWTVPPINGLCHGCGARREICKFEKFVDGGFVVTRFDYSHNPR